LGKKICGRCKGYFLGTPKAVGDFRFMDNTYKASNMGVWSVEVQAGQRFRFGQNWQKFIESMDDGRIATAMEGLRDMLGVTDLAGSSFLDIGSGSGLSSLAAMRLGARAVRSIDFDPQSVACTENLRHRYYPESEGWVVEEGSVLDEGRLKKLGTYDVVYSWGVLHHTGKMWQAMASVCSLVKPGGRLFIAIYNDEGEISRIWRQVKILYNRNGVARVTIFTTFFVWQLFRGLVVDLFVRHQNPLTRYGNYKATRGMSFTRDLSDWLGGYPYEVAKPEQVFEFFRSRGFELIKMKTVGRGLGNNEFVFARLA
jgi:2-polyprenyl-3-methyl-5-hydroxy-6-metoxy-1,4-benzoquinol methylase